MVAQVGDDKTDAGQICSYQQNDIPRLDVRQNCIEQKGCTAEDQGHTGKFAEVFALVLGFLGCSAAITQILDATPDEQQRGDDSQPLPVGKMQIHDRLLSGCQSALWFQLS